MLQVNLYYMTIRNATNGIILLIIEIFLSNTAISHDGSMYAIYGNMDPINIPQSCQHFSTSTMDPSWVSIFHLPEAPRMRIPKEFMMMPIGGDAKTDGGDGKIWGKDSNTTIVYHSAIVSMEIYGDHQIFLSLRLSITDDHIHSIVQYSAIL